MIPVGVIDVILPAALWVWGSNQPLTEMNTRDITLGGGVKIDQCTGLTILQTSFADCLEIWEPETSGTARACLGL